MVRVSGSEAINIADTVFKSKKNIRLADVKSHTVHFGIITDGESEIDEVLAIVVREHNT